MLANEDDYGQFLRRADWVLHKHTKARPWINVLLSLRTLHRALPAALAASSSCGWVVQKGVWKWSIFERCAKARNAGCLSLVCWLAGPRASSKYRQTVDANRRPNRDSIGCTARRL